MPRHHPLHLRFYKPKKGQLKKLKRLAKKTAIYGGIGFFVIMAGFYLTLPNIDDLNRFAKARSILIKAENGQIIGSFGDIYGDYLSFNDLPSSLVDAVIATEDRNFYHHWGIDPWGLARAGFADLKARHVVQGGSTITQQVAKNAFLTPERSFTRKIREMLLALKLEHRFSKQEIISIYLNRVYLGSGNYGVDAASKRYFGKTARELTLNESAILAGMLKAPSRFSPTNNPVLSKKRAEQVLLNMEDAGYLSKPQTEKARADLNNSLTGQRPSPQSSLYFADWVADQIPQYVGNVQEDLVVTTTLNPDWQQQAEKSINDVLDKDGKAKNVSQAALLCMTPDGAIRVMVGGRSYGQSQFNRTTQSLRQPGSSFKLFVYLAGLESGLYTPDTQVDDHPISVPISGGNWWPKNYTGKFLGVMPLRDAVAQSINTVSVQVSQAAGLDHVIDMARRLGVTTPIDPVPAIALGATEVTLLEMTTAYAHMASNGVIVYPYGIEQIDTPDGNTIYTRHSSGGGVALSPDTVGKMNELLLGVVEHGTGGAARIGRPVAGKTGTTSDYKDAWFMGYTPDLVTGVWVGNDNNDPMKKVTGGTLPASIWHNFMIEAEKDMPIREIPIHNVPSAMPWQKEAPVVRELSPEEREQREEGLVGEDDVAPQGANAPEGAGTVETTTEEGIPAGAPVEQQALPAPGTEAPQPASGQPEPDKAKLPKSFWDKLLKH